jgi:hypothetical protein
MMLSRVKSSPHGVNASVDWKFCALLHVFIVEQV